MIHWNQFTLENTKAIRIEYASNGLNRVISAIIVFAIFFLLFRCMKAEFGRLENSISKNKNWFVAKIYSVLVCLWSSYSFRSTLFVSSSFDSRCSMFGISWIFRYADALLNWCGNIHSNTYTEIMTLSLNHRLNVQAQIDRHNEKKEAPAKSAPVYRIYNLKASNTQVCWFACFFSIRWFAFVCCFDAIVSMSQRIQLYLYRSHLLVKKNSSSIELDCSSVEFSRVLHLSLFDHFTFP